MEKVKGVSLDSVYSKMKIEDRVKVVEAVGRFQKKWASIPYPGYGSLYFASDVDSKHKTISFPVSGNGNGETSKYVLGPVTGRQWNDNGRLLVDFERGPCESKQNTTYNI